MYLYVRSRQLQNDADVDWAAAVRARMAEVTGNDVRLWEKAYSPGTGTVRWTSWWDDLATLDRAVGGLRDDDAYSQLARDGAASAVGPADDVILGVVHGDPAVEMSSRYVRSLEAVGAQGTLDRGLTSGVEILKKSEEITGVPSLFVRAVTGTMGAFAWLSGYPDLGTFQATNEKLLTGSTWLWFRDRHAEGLSGSPMQMALYRRVDDQ
jgi:hypothetical protein